MVLIGEKNKKYTKKIDYKIKFFEALLLSREKKYKASENILNKYKLEKYFEKNIGYSFPQKLKILTKTKLSSQNPHFCLMLSIQHI